MRQIERIALTYIYTLPCVKQAASSKLMYNTGSPAQRSVMTSRGGRGAQEEGDTRALIADSCCCSAETNTTLYSNYTPI